MGWQALSRVGNAVSALGTLAILTRVIDLAAIGVFGVYEALFALLDVAVDGGSASALVRRAGARPDGLRPLLRCALQFRLASATTAAAVALLAFGIDTRTTLSSPWPWLAAATLLGHVPGVYGTLFHLRLDFRMPSSARGIAALAGLLAVAVGAIAGLRDPVGFLCVHLAARSVAGLFLWRAAAPLVAAYPRRAVAGDTAGYVAESLLLGGGALLRETYGRIDLWLLRALAGVELAGLYTPVRKTLNLALQLPSFVTVVAMPALAAQAGASFAAVRAHSWLLARRLAAFALGAALLIIWLVPWYLQAAFGTEFATASDALRILAVAALFAYPAGALITGLLAAGRAGSVLALSAFALAVSLAGNFALIPAFGMAGAAWARAATEGAALGGAAARLR